MSTLALIILFSLSGYYIYRLEKNLYKIEDKQGKGLSQTFKIDVRKALLSHYSFGKLTGLKSSEEGKDFNEWTPTDKNTWHEKYSTIVSNKCVLCITYLSIQDCFFIKTKEDFNIMLKDDDKNLLYSEIIVGDATDICDCLTFLIYERLKKDKEASYRVLTLCLEESFQDLNKSPLLYVLLDFPYQELSLTSEIFKRQGFNIQKIGDDYIGTDPFGDPHCLPTKITLTKNKASISF